MIQKELFTERQIDLLDSMAPLVQPDEVEMLSQQASAQPILVLSHNDLLANNLLISPVNKLFLIDF